MHSINKKVKILLQHGTYITCIWSQENRPGTFLPGGKYSLSPKDLIMTVGTVYFINKTSVFCFSEYYCALGSRWHSSLTMCTINTHDVTFIFLNACNIDFWHQRNWTLMLHLFLPCINLPIAKQLEPIHYQASIF